TATCAPVTTSTRWWPSEAGTDPGLAHRRPDRFRPRLGREPFHAPAARVRDRGRLRALAGEPAAGDVRGGPDPGHAAGRRTLGPPRPPRRRGGRAGRRSPRERAARGGDRQLRGALRRPGPRRAAGGRGRG